MPPLRGQRGRVRCHSRGQRQGGRAWSSVTFYFFIRFRTPLADPMASLFGSNRMLRGAQGSWRAGLSPPPYPCAVRDAVLPGGVNAVAPRTRGTQPTRTSSGGVAEHASALHTCVPFGSRRARWRGLTLTLAEQGATPSYNTHHGRAAGAPLPPSLVLHPPSLPPSPPAPPPQTGHLNVCVGCMWRRSLAKEPTSLCAATKAAAPECERRL